MVQRKPSVHECAQDAADELTHASDLVASQVAAGLSAEEVTEALYNSWADRLSKLSHLGPTDKIAITSALARGPWTDDQRKELARALLGGSVASTASSKKRANQKCLHFENFLPQAVWLKLKDPVQFSQLTRASFLATVAHSIGIECPDQPTLYRMVSILAYCERNYDMGQDEVHKLMDKIQGFIKGHPRVSGVPYLEHYPVAAKELSSEHQRRAYGSADLPVDVDIPELSIILGDTKMRGRKKEVLPDWLRHVPDAYKSAVTQQINATKRGGGPSSSFDPGHEMYSPMPSASLLRIAQTSPRPPLPLTYELPSPSPKGVPERIEAKASPRSTSPVREPELATTPPVGVQELEESLLAGLMGKPRKRKKGEIEKATGVIPKPSRAKKVKTAKVAAEKPIVMKKPAAAILKARKKPIVMKKPAAHKGGSKLDLQSIFAKLRALKGKTDYKRFVSIAYHDTRRLAHTAGYSEEEAKAFARDAHGQASLIFKAK